METALFPLSKKVPICPIEILACRLAQRLAIQISQQNTFWGLYWDTLLVFLAVTTVKKQQSLSAWRTRILCKNEFA
ncbi:MAG TPA: hypothetical protein PK299_15050 [Anaerolineales bacterium]|nr:hypothetical protein [Anaerolineales bacterium]